MQPLLWDRRPDGLRAPALLCAFTGWNDAGDAASAALSFIGTSLGATRFAHIDPEEFFDFQAQRPRVRLTESRVREITWPQVEIFEARVPRAHRDLILLQGPEPSMRWRTFTALIVELAEALGVQFVITVGALLADVPHTLPVHVTGISSDESLVGRMDLRRSSYEGPTGITGVLHAACAEAGLPSAGLWASVPHYVAAAPNPKAALALVRKVEGLVGIAVDATDLETASAEYERQVGLAVQSDPEVQAFVERLERAAEDDRRRGPDRPAVGRSAGPRVPALPAPARRRRQLRCPSARSVSTRPPGPMRTFIAQPDGEGPFPAGLIYMDAPGYREALRDVARRYAAGRISRRGARHVRAVRRRHHHRHQRVPAPRASTATRRGACSATSAA